MPPNLGETVLDVPYVQQKDTVLPTKTSLDVLDTQQSGTKFD